MPNRTLLAALANIIFGAFFFGLLIVCTIFGLADRSLSDLGWKEVEMLVVFLTYVAHGVTLACLGFFVALVLTSK